MKGDFHCPECGGCYFGSSSHPEGTITVICHDQYKVGCEWRGDRFAAEYWIPTDGICGHGYNPNYCPVCKELNGD